MPNFARLDLSFSSAIAPVFYLVPTANYNLLSQPARLVIRSKAGIQIFNETGIAAGITIVDHLLTDDLQYPDGSVILAGETVKAWRVAPDLSAVPMYDPLNNKMQQSRYGFTADPGGAEWVIEGFWSVWPDTGPVPHFSQSGEKGVQIGGAISAGVFFPGTQGATGAQGLPGPWVATSKLVSTDYTITADDSLVFVQANGADITISCPPAESLWLGNAGKVIVIARVPGDTGTVTITGDADGLPFVIYASESLYITTTDGIQLIADVSPFVLNVEQSATSGYILTDFTATDLLAGAVSAGIPPAGRYIFDIDINISSPLDCTLSVGTALDPDFYFTTGPANVDYTTPVRSVSDGGEFFLSANGLTLPAGSGKIIITYI